MLLYEHLRKAREQRELYNQRTREAAESYKNYKTSTRRMGQGDIPGPPPLLCIGCIAYDYAVALKIPHAVQETQGEYMARVFGMDVFCFGICHEGKADECLPMS